MGRTWELAPDTWIVAGLTLDPRSEARIDPFGPLAAAFRHRVPILLPDNPAELCQIATQIVGEFGESPVLESTVLDVLPAHCSQTVSLHTLRNWLENSLRLAHTAPTITRKHFETAMIEDLDWAIRQLSFRGMDLDRDHVLRWMEGFDLPLQALALSLIRVIQSNYYLDLTRYFGELRGLMAKSNIPRGSSVVFCKWQPEGKSAPHIAHDLRIEGYWKVKFDIDFTKKDFEKLEGLQRTRPYWFILSDDLVGTGNTLCRMLEEPSSPVYELLDFFPKGQVRLLILAGFEQGLRRARQAILRSRHRGRLEVIVGRLYQDRDRCFHPTSTIFPRKDQRDQFQEFCLKTAQHKMKLHEDYWLGYEQSEALVVFYNRVPNNSLPVLWCSRNWFPLFVQSQDK